MKKPNHKSYLLVAVQLLCICVIVFNSNIRGGEPLIWVMILAGLSLGIWAIWAMRLDNVNILPDPREDSKLIQRGPYRYIRHPMYSSVLLVTLALVLNEFSFLRLSFWIILFLDLMFKLQYEERQLLARFDEYAAYLHKTKRIIPYVY